MSENEMGYRGTKTKFNLLNLVKAQRVDGRSYERKISYQRCTLKGFERNYQFRIPTWPLEPGAISKLGSCSNQQSMGGLNQLFHMSAYQKTNLGTGLNDVCDRVH
jgi:hypothetical protein